jgi:hypothetical protein
MKTWQSVKRLLFAIALLAFGGLAPAARAQTVPNIPGVPPISTATQTPFQQQTHFLTFLGSFIPESAASAKAYYAAIDPNNTKPTFTKWLLNAGFISDESQWHPYGAQDIRTGQPAGVYGPNIINTDSHVIVLNAADLGFVRNQFIRCKPSCTAFNPIIYTYLENYPVAPFASGGSGFPGATGYPTQAEATAAINSALTRPLGVKGGDGMNPCAGDPNCIERIADVAFEWAPPPDGTSPNTRYGQLYAYVFSHTGPGIGGITETISASPGQVGQSIPDFSNPTGPFLTINAGDPFPPNLDGQGFKQHPGVCFICHGGKPTNLVSGVYPRKGKVDGFRLLPLDNRNLLFTSDSGPELTSRLNQEADTKKYNLAVLQTVPFLPQRDDQGTVRLAHIAEVIRGWYAGCGNYCNVSVLTPLSGTTQNGNFIPAGWREPSHGGTASAGSEALYLNTVAPSCRSCHFNRELSLDFGTVANFNQESDLLQLSLLPECQASNPDPNKRPMPLALLTYEKLWQGQPVAPQPLTDGTFLTNTVLQLKNHFGYTATSYCASHP